MYGLMVWLVSIITILYSSKEYGAIYIDSNGEKVKPGCEVGITCIKSYKGEYVSEEYTHVGTTSKENTHVGTTSEDTLMQAPLLKKPLM